MHHTYVRSATLAVVHGANVRRGAGRVCAGVPPALRCAARAARVARIARRGDAHRTARGATLQHLLFHRPSSRRVLSSWHSSALYSLCLDRVCIPSVNHKPKPICSLMLCVREAIRCLLEMCDCLPTIIDTINNKYKYASMLHVLYGAALSRMSACLMNTIGKMTFLCLTPVLSCTSTIHPNLFWFNFFLCFRLPVYLFFYFSCTVRFN